MLTRSLCECGVAQDCDQLWVLSNTPHSEYSLIPTSVPQPEQGGGERSFTGFGERKLRSQSKEKRYSPQKGRRRGLPGLVVGMA